MRPSTEEVRLNETSSVPSSLSRLAEQPYLMLLLLFNPVQMRPRPQIKCLPRDRGRRQKPLLQAILPCLFEHPPRLERRRLAVLAKKPQPVIRAQWRRRVLPANPMLPHLFPGLGIDATGNPRVADHVNQIIHQQDGRLIRNPPLYLPRHMRIGNQPFAARAYRE